MRYLLTLCLCSWFLIAKAELLLVYEVEFYPLLSANSASKDSISKQDISLYLSDSVFHVIRGKQINVYDFMKEKIYYLNMPAKTYDETSLYSEIDFRATEFLNRLYMKQFLEKGNVPNSIGTLFEIESLFGLEKSVDSLKGAVSAIPADGRIDYFVADQKICSVSYSDIRLGNYTEVFHRFLLYETQIHPSILRSISGRNLVPRELSFKFKNSGKEYFVRYRLKKHEPDASVTELNFNYYFFEYNFPNSLLSRINKIYGYVHHQPFEFKSREKVLEEYQLAVDRNNFLDAFLILMEAKLSSNEDFSPEFTMLREIGDRDKNFVLFMNVLEKPEEELDLPTKIELVENLQKKRKLSRAWLLDAFLANYYASLEQTQKAIELLEKVIDHSPYITAVYVDLGELFVDTYKMKTAWKCFEIALRLNPDHPMAQRILYKKQYLKYTFPEYFF